MSKATEARVRDELLQTLNSHVLRSTLAEAAGGLRGDDAATAAGVYANLHDSDTVLLPARHVAGFRVLRGLSAAPAKTSTARDRAARVYPLPRSEAQAVAFCLAMAMAAADAEVDAPAGPANAVVVVLPPRAKLHSSHARRRELPSTWSDAAAYAARAALPILFVSVAGSPGDKAMADPSMPAPLYPSIPVDREDALAAYRVAFECLGRARAGGGPSHLCAGRYPASAGGISAGALARLEAMLRKRGCYSKAWQRTLEREITRELAGRP
jgi:hypothetical protein